MGGGDVVEIIEDALTTVCFWSFLMAKFLCKEKAARCTGVA